MKLPRWAQVLVAVLLLLGIAYHLGAERVAEIAADALLHINRHLLTQTRPNDAQDVVFTGGGVTLQGWLFPARLPKRGTIIYLHGISDNRGGSLGVAQFFTPRGFDVLAYDSRGHGQSTGAYCTYGFLEKQDLHRVIDTLPAQSIILIGISLGATIALQEAADDRRITAVVASETFSDLRTIARERAPSYLTSDIIRRAFRKAGQKAHFEIDDASPVAAARRMTAPVLLIHGARDQDTRPEHSRRVFAALRSPKQLILVPDAWHNGALKELGWPKVAEWIDGIVPPAS